MASNASGGVSLPGDQLKGMRTSATRPPSSLAFDWTMGAFSLLIMIGVFQDGWAHNHGLVDQSFLTPWHAILYGTMAVTGLFLLAAGLRNLRRGYSLRNGLPLGYWTSALGVTVFLLGGLFDFWWHSMFGIEVDIEGLISPSHLTLAFGGMLVFAGTLRSIGAQYGPAERRWRTLGPAILASIAVLMLLGFFTQYASPLGDGTMLGILGPAHSSAAGSLYAVRADGSGEVRIATKSGRDLLGATVSPDARRVAVRIQPMNGGQLPPSDLYVFKTNGTGGKQITHSGRHDTEPAWSRDGKRIAYISIPANTSGEYELHVVNADGSGNAIVAHGVTRMLSPEWTPDGSHIAVGSRNGLIDEIEVFPAKGGAGQWLDATVNGAAPAYAANGTLAFELGSDIVALPPGAHTPHTLVKNASSPAFTPDGKHLVYVQAADSEMQVFYANADGTHAVNVSALTGLSADGDPQAAQSLVFFTAAGHAQAMQTGIGKSYGLDSAILSSAILMGVLLLFVRRWRTPAGAMTVLLGVYGLAMNTQSDLYFLLPAAIITGVLADVYLLTLNERARSGALLYIFAFAVPAVLFALYEYSVAATSGFGWPFDLMSGSPLIAGFAGLLVAFCYAPPLNEASAPASAGAPGTIGAAQERVVR